MDLRVNDWDSEPETHQRFLGDYREHFISIKAAARDWREETNRELETKI